jgi:hypothetical protein
MIAKYRKVCNGTIDSRVVTNKKPFERGLFLFITYCSKGIINDIGTAFYLKH